jgi:hypothetical protein
VIDFFEQRPQAQGLGRHVLHDERSREYDAATLISGAPHIASIMHKCHTEPWDQGQIGSCTANAALGVLMTDPFWQKGKWGFRESDALRLYEEETRLDNSLIPGSYPPVDTGSTGLWSMKALKAAGYISSYRHAFSLNTALQLLMQYPVSSGLPWYNSMFEPDRNHFIHLEASSGIAGGHQVAVVGVDVAQQAVRIRNSWGTSWGDGGYCWLSWGDWGALLKQRGDVVVPVI